MQKEKIILDCDPGHDDAVAIMLAAINPKIELLGITVVAGNQKLEKTVNNALKVCNHLNLDVPVFSGMSRPMIREQLIADDIHGETGLDGPKFEELKIIGRISLYDYNSRNLSFEIGFLLLSKYKGLGIMTVALKSVIKHLFTFGVVNKIYAQTCELNKNSIKLLERSNFKQDGRLREHHKIGDRLVDDLIYSILSKDFVEETVDD